ncbi:hypothetical protein [Sorangium sp. So ce861]|uniref:hypothetical protein n=1 Tax=Sorangium sp. So ce861 TaxID=3133323 RepID=UPI003F5D9AE5
MAMTSEHALLAGRPTLFRYRAIGGAGSEMRYAAELPQEDGMTILLRLEGCLEERVVRELFGVRRSAIAERTDVVFDATTPMIACPDRIAADANVYAEPRTQGLSRLEYRLDGEPPEAGPGRYFVIPNRCGGLMNHLGIAERARRAPAPPLGSPGWTPEPGATPIELSCANERATEPYDGWEVHSAWLPSVEFRWMVLVKKGDTSFFVESLDGRPYNDLTDAERESGLAGLRRLLAVPTSSESTDVVPEDEEIRPDMPFFDVCLSRCGAADWVPAHKVLRDGYLECESGSLDPSTGGCVDGERRGYTDRLELNGTTSRRAPLGGVVLDLPLCTAGETWERHLGLTGHDGGGTWLTRLIAAYNAGKSEGAAPPSVSLPCLVPDRTCSVTLREGADLSTTTVATLTRNCAVDAEALEVRVGKGATLSRQPFTLDAAVLPATMRRVRMVGVPEGSIISVAQPTCGFGTGAPCTEAQPAISVQGDLTVDLEHLRLVSRPPTGGTAGPPKPLARVGVQAAGSAARGLVLRVRDVVIGGDTAPVFYKGIVFSGGTLALHSSSVRAFTDGVSVDRARVSIVSWPVAGAHTIESLAQPGLTADDLVDLRGAWIGGSVANFRALTLSADVQAFVVGMRVSGPMAVAWSDDRAAWPEDGLLAVDSTFTSAPGYFDRESVMLSVTGRSQLNFVNTRVANFGHVLRCPSRLSGGTARIIFDRPEFDEITYGLRQGACTFESATLWDPTGE